MKTALITGTTSGLGEAIATYYSKNDYQVIGISRQSKDIQCDLSDQKDLTDYCLGMVSRFHKFDVLVNNAGALFLNEGIHNANHLYNLLLYTPYVLMTQLANRLQGGHVINIASVSGMMADPDTPMYGALKAGVISLTKSFARKLAPNTRVNCISPGFFDTNLVPDKAPFELLKPLAIKREASPFEIIPVVRMLDTTPYITGANIVIDGGKTA
jgi:NAD(P)-dependent dehydrogenase (short-subunit alcohol dehydrogenase family)